MGPAVIAIRPGAQSLPQGRPQRPLSMRERQEVQEMLLDLRPRHNSGKQFLEAWLSRAVAECGPRIGVRTWQRNFRRFIPGEILREEFLVPLKLTPYAVAAALRTRRVPGSNASRARKSPLRPTPRCGSASSSRPALRSG